MLSQNVSRLRTGRPNMYYGKGFSVDVMSRAWERNIVCSSVQIYYSLRAWRLKAAHYFTQEFDATSFSERNRNRTE